MATLYVYLDESGNLDFSPTGSRYYVFAAAWTLNPAPLANKLTNLRFGLQKNGYDLQAFHATDDKQEHRNAVVTAMISEDEWKYAAIVLEKAKVNPSIREPKKFYPKFAIMPLRFIFRGVVRPTTSKVMVYTDVIPISKHRDSVEKAIKTACRRDLPDDISFLVYHHDKKSNKWLQVVDYCSWAVFRKWEGNDDRTYSQLKPRLAKPELEVTGRGEDIYYFHPAALSN